MRYSDVTKVNVITRRHVGKMLNAEVRKFLFQSYLQTAYFNTQQFTSIPVRKFMMLHCYTAATSRHFHCTIVDSMNVLSSYV